MPLLKRGSSKGFPVNFARLLFWQNDYFIENTFICCFFSIGKLARTLAAQRPFSRERTKRAIF